MCGSFQFRVKDEAHTWRSYDQIVISQDLQSKIEKFAIHQQIGDADLLNKRATLARLFRAAKSPDHLPVELILKLRSLEWLIRKIFGK